MSTNDFTNEYKKKVDALQTLYRFKGNVETLTELNSKTDNNIGDTWNCEEDGNNYCWNKTEWVNIGTNIDLSSYATKTELTELQTNIENSIQEVADTVVTETATTTANGLMSKEDKAKLDTLKKTEIIQKDGEATTENVYSAEAVKELLKDKKDKQNITTGQEFETGRIIDGKKEYGKRIDCGLAPLSSTLLEINHGLTNIVFTDYWGICGYNKEGWCEKIDRYSPIKMIMYGDKIRIYSENDDSHNANYQCMVELHYLKK